MLALCNLLICKLTIHSLICFVACVVFNLFIYSVLIVINVVLCTILSVTLVYCSHGDRSRVLVMLGVVFTYYVNE